MVIEPPKENLYKVVAVRGEEGAFMLRSLLPPSKPLMNSLFPPPTFLVSPNASLGQCNG